MDSEVVIREICELLWKYFGFLATQKATGTELLKIIKIVFLDAVTKNIKAVIAFKSIGMWGFFVLRSFL